MKHPKISVIVPVYNAELYLSRCIDSILSQEFNDFELLLIDDGSKDRSGVICDEYANIDNRIRVFHKLNGGVSSARNLGLEKAKGNWISFIDSDDSISRDFLIFDKKFENADVIEKNYSYNYSNGKSVKKIIVKNDCILNNREDIFNFFVNKRTNALWNKLISRKLIGEHKFDSNLKIGEDFIFFAKLLPLINTYAFTNKGTYFYYINVGSALSTLSNNYNEKIKLSINFIKMINALYNQKELLRLRYDIIYSTYLERLLIYEKFMNNHDKQFFKEFLKKYSWNNYTYLNYKLRLKILFKYWKHIFKL